MRSSISIAGEMLGRQIEQALASFCASAGLREAVYGEERISGSILDDGTTLPADLLVLACGDPAHVST